MSVNKCQPVDHVEGGDDGHENEPEPHEDVDLLVEDVQGEDAHCVVLLNFTGRAKLVERALGHAREDVDHRIDPVLLIPLCKADDLYAEG